MNVLMMAISGRFELWHECYRHNAQLADRILIRLDGHGMTHEMIRKVEQQLPYGAHVYVSHLVMDKWNWRQEMLEKAQQAFALKKGDWILFPDEDEKLPDIDYTGRGQMIFQFLMVTDGHDKAFQYPALPHMKAFSYEQGLSYAPYRHCARINGPKGYADLTRKELVQHYCFYRKEWRDAKVKSIEERYPDYFKKYPMR